MTARDFFRNKGVMLSLYLVFVAAAMYFILRYERNEIHLYVNQYVGNRYINAFFFWITLLGDGWVAPLLVLILGVMNARAGISGLCAWLLAVLISSALKYLVFDDVHRPHFIFQYFDRRELNVVEGVHLNIHNSFPSGHATQAFAVFMTMALYTRRNMSAVIFLLFAVLSAFSRVYLSQHWLADIVAGSLIGTLSSLLFYFVYFYRGKLRGADKPLIALLQRKKE